MRIDALVHVLRRWSACVRGMARLRNRRGLAGAGLLAMSLLPSVALAGPPYRLVQLDYRYLELDKRNKFDGAALVALLPVAGRLHVHGAVMRLDGGDTMHAELDVGLARSLSPATDFVVRSGYQWRDTDGASERGWRLAAGVRSMTTPNMEVSAIVRHAVLDRGRTSLDLGGRFALDARFAIAVGADVSADDVLYHAGLSFSF